MKTSLKVLSPGVVNAHNAAAEETDRPLKICVVFDDDVSAGSAEVLIRHVDSDVANDTHSFHFNELNSESTGVAAARSNSDTDILLLAIRDDRMLPAHVQWWLGLCLGLRNENQEGALVVLSSARVLLLCLIRRRSLGGQFFSECFEERAEQKQAPA